MDVRILLEFFPTTLLLLISGTDVCNYFACNFSVGNFFVGNFFGLRASRFLRTAGDGAIQL